MGRASKVQTMVPKPLLERINQLFMEHKTIDDVLAMLRADPDAPDISRSSLGRHRKTIAEIASKLRYAREFTAGLRQEIGDSSEADQARLNNELVQTAIFDFMMKIEDGEADAGTIKAVSEALNNLARASKTNQDFIGLIERKAEARAQKAAAAVVDTFVKTKGVTAATAEAIKAQIFGVQPAAPAHG